MAGLHGAPNEVFDLAKSHDVFEVFSDVFGVIKTNSLAQRVPPLFIPHPPNFACDITRLNGTLNVLAY